jgi:uncharacterized protein (TIGR02266 family)
MERRNHVRTPAILRITYESAGVLKTDYAENISRGGLFVSTDEPMALGARVQLELSCVGTSIRIPVVGTVRWSGMRSPGDDQPPVMGVGIELTELDDPVRRAHLEALVDAAFEPAGPVDPRDHLRVLVVDPNAFARELFRNGLLAMAKELLDVDDYVQVHEAESGLEAMELCRGVRFDLFIIELRTPELDGTEVIRRVRRQFSQVTPVFAMSRPYAGAKADAISAGADVYLPKPVQLKPLFNTLKMLLKLGDRRPPGALSA